MKLKKWILFPVCLMLAGLLCACSAVLPGQSKFDRQVDSGSFSLKLDPLNSEVSETFELKAGDSVAVDVVREAGKIGIAIGKPGQEPVYEGSDVQSGAFRVNIREDGSYAITVSGSGAKGSVSFRMLPAEPAETTEAPTNPSPDPIPTGEATEPATEPVPTETVPETGYRFSHTGTDSRIREALGEELYGDYARLMDALFAAQQEVTLPHTASGAEFRQIQDAVQMNFILNDFLCDPGYLTQTPFTFTPQTQTVSIRYCWEDETLEPEERPCNSREEYLQKVQEFQDLVTDIFARYVTDYENKPQTAKELFDYVADNYTYEINRTITPYRAMYLEKGYCAIFACVYQYLMGQAGIDCWRCSGTVEMGWNDHEWNIIRLDGCYYHVDTTYQATDGSIDGYYFAMSDELCVRLGHGEKENFNMSDELSVGQPMLVCEDQTYDRLYRSWMVGE